MVTYGSSFGYVATAWAGRPAHFLQHLYQNYTYRDDEVRVRAAQSGVLTLRSLTSTSREAMLTYCSAQDAQPTTCTVGCCSPCEPPLSTSASCRC